MIIETDKTIPEAIQKIVGTNGIFHIRWRKKDRRQFVDNEFGFPVINPDYDKNTILRTGNFRLGVVKNLKGGKRNTDPNEYLIAFDMSKKGYRNIYYNTIERITVNKQTFFVKVVDTKHYRFALIDSTNKKGMENI
tara:strand:- start:585 stop:992 length:408 start_codon:yes stop_codon:yes gene_type:complete